MNFAERVKRVREALDMSMNELARRAHVDTASISLIERGKQSPRLDTMLRIADGLGVPLLTLLGGKSIGDDPEETEVLTYYRQLPEPVRKSTRAHIAALAAQAMRFLLGNETGLLTA